MLKKILIFIVFVFLLTSCFDSENFEKTNNTASPLLKKFVQTDFEMDIPNSWEVLKSNNEIFPKPAYWEIVFDAKSTKAKDGFYRNILVLKQELQDKNIDSLEYMTSNYIWAKKNYFYIKKIEEQNVKIDNKKTKLYVFEARYSEDTPIAKFLQTWLICDNGYAYLITLALEKNNKNIDRYKWILGSFKCKNSSK